MIDLSHLVGGLVSVILVHSTHNLLQTNRHSIRSFFRSIVPLQIFKKAQEKRIDSHDIDTEEGGSDKISTDNYDNDWREQIVEGWNVILELRNLAAEDKVG